MDETEKLKEEVASLNKQIHDLEKDLIHDSLTSLKTRRFFEEETDTYLSAIANVDDGKTRKEWFGFKNISILYFDIDHFKKINDTYGHEVGDRVLQDVSGVISRSVREGDTVARWGGEEIVASLLGADEKDAKKKAEDIRKSIKELNFDEPELKVTISVGVSINYPGARCKDLLKNADLALYQAKRGGRNQVVAFSELKV
jgi:diguanylate cyclase (GGDEF)-like protein